MAKSANQKLKLLYLREYMLRYSDEEHPVTVAQIIAHLESCGITAERKSIYSDIEALRTFGLDILKVRSAQTGYYVASRDFELPELKLLVDSVQSSKFITSKKTLELISKIEKLGSESDGKQLHRQVFVSGRIKTMNESIYYNVDEIHSAIAQDRKITFKYFEYSPRKERVYRHGGEPYCVSPLALTWDDENYYLIAFDENAGIIKHYRVDKMTGIAITGSRRSGENKLGDVDIAQYANTHFGMFTGEKQRVCMRFANHLAGAVIDRFGKDVTIIQDTDDSFSVYQDISVSPRFFGWMCGFRAEAKIISPPEIVEKMRCHVKKIAEQY